VKGMLPRAYICCYYSPPFWGGVGLKHQLASKAANGEDMSSHLHSQIFFPENREKGNNPMAKTLVSAFSFNMVPVALAFGSIQFRRITKEEAKALLACGWSAGIGHADTAAVVATDLGAAEGSLFSRTTLVVNPGDELLLAQYSGPRLEAGAHVLPTGAKLEYLHVTIG